MKIEEKTREQLLAENESLRAMFSELKKAESECRWVEAALRESEERYKRLLESITDYIYTVKVENCRPVSTIHSPGCLAVTGYTSVHYQMYPNLWYEMIHEEDRGEVLKQAENILSGGAVQPLEHRIIHKNGSILWVRNTPVPHYDKDGNLISYDGLISGITERKMADEQLRTIFDNTTDGILLADIESKRFYIGNKRICEMLGYSIDEIKALGVIDIHPEKDLPYVIDQFERQAMKEFTIAKDIPVKRKDGSVFYADINSSPVTLGGKTYLLGIFRDITERKKAEEAMRASREYARNIIESSMDMIIAVDKDRRITEFNKAAQETFGYALEEVLGRHIDILYTDPSEGLRVHDVTMANGRHLQEIVNRRKNGELFPSLLSSSVLKNAQGEIVGLMGISHDITERKKAEDALKESFASIERAKKEWEATFDAISDPLYIHDRAFKIVRANKAYQQMAGMKFKEFIGWPYYEVFPKMKGPFGGCIRTMKTGEPSEEEVTLPSVGKFFKVGFYPVMYRNGEYHQSVHIMEDITELKKAEERIKEEAEITSHLLMIAEATSHMTDIDRLMERVVQCGSKIMGCDICLSYLWDSETRVLSPSQEFGLSHNLVPLFKTESLDMKTGFVKEAMKGKKPIIVAAPFTGAHDAGLKPAATFDWLPDINTLVVIPLIGKKGPLGLIVGVYTDASFMHRQAQHEREKAAPPGLVEGQSIFTEWDMKIMQGIMHQVSVALDEAKFYKESIDKAMELSHQIETVQTMHEIDRSILSTLEPQEILETAARMVARLMPCDRVTVALVDREKKGFVYAGGFGITAVSKGGLVPFEDTSATEVAETHRAQFVSNLSETKGLRPLEEKLLNEGFLSHIRVPLTIKDEVVGVLNVGAKRPSAFSPEDLSTLEKMAAQTGVALSNAKLISDMEELFLGTVKSLSTAIDAKSPWTAGHSERVTKYALDIAKEMGFGRDEMRSLELAGLLHDIGKIGTYDFLLDKPGKLEPDEIEMVRLHPGKGAEILEPIKRFGNIIPTIRHHHEFYDGTGYPDMLKGEDIPFLARILAVADTYDAMKADRPYRPGRSMEFILEEFRRCSGTQFDPKVVEAFLKVIEEKEEIKTAAS